jgi:hypothetical protein
VVGFDVRFGEFSDDWDSAESEDYAEAFDDRRRRALNWATQVAIPLDDKYSGYFVHLAREDDLAVTMGRQRFEDRGDVVWDAESDVEDVATFVDDPVGHDATDRQTSADAKWDAESNKADVPDPEWDIGATPGREGDLAEPVDQYLSLEPNDQDEPRLDRNDLEGADPGGDGDPSSGKKNWLTGK